MHCQLPIDMDRFRRLQEKGKISPKVGAAVVNASPSVDAVPLTPNPGYQRSMMPIANPYREAPETPQLMSHFGCSPNVLPGGDRSSQIGDDGSNRQKQLTVSLFDEAKRQRYEKFRSRIRHSQSPSKRATSNNAIPKIAQEEQHPTSQLSRHDLQQCDKQCVDDESQSAETSNDRYALSRVKINELQTGDKYSFPYVCDFSQQSENGDRGQSTPKTISPSKRSAFKTPKYYTRRQIAPSAKKTGPKEIKEYPAPPSVTPSQQLSNHPMNSLGLPIASARHDLSTPRQMKSKNFSLPSVIKLDDPKKALGTPSPKAMTQTPHARRGEKQNETNTSGFSHEKTPPDLSSSYNGLPLASSWRPHEQQSTVEYSRDQDQNSPYSRKHPPTFPADIRKKASLTINTRSTPTAKSPGLAYISSFERGVTPPPGPPPIPSQKTSLSLEGSEGTSSTMRKDRILEARGIQQVQQDPESREPLEEMHRLPIDHRRNTRDASSPPPSLELRPSLELPSLKSHYSSESQHATPPRNEYDTSNNENIPKGVTPLDFYRRITAEKSRQVARAKQLSGLTPTKDAPSPSRISSPIFRADSPRSSSAPVLDQRTVRLLYSREFNQMIREHVAFHTREILQKYAKKKNGESNARGVALFARKRPLLDYEAVNGEFDVVNAATGQTNAMIVYVTLMLSDLQTKDIQASLHEFDHVFSEARLAEDIYIRMAQAEVIRARDGGAAAFIFLGSQGSGKTHSVADIEERVAYDLFESSRGPRSGFVSVQYLELYSDKIVDLLGPVDNCVRIVEEAGSYRLKGSTSKSATCPRDLLSVMSDARRRLARVSTNRRLEYKQGYILCHMLIDLQQTKGSLILLECPASELSFRNDKTTMFHGLMARIRAKVEGHSKDSLFKGESNITKIMHDVLNNPDGKVSILATVSPAASHTEETISILNSLSSLKRGNAHDEPVRNNTNNLPPLQRVNDSPRSVDSTGELTLPRQWSHDELVEWMRRKNLLVDPVPCDVNGRIAMRMTKRQLKGMFYNVTEDEAKAERLYMALRAENDRVARMRVKVRMARERQKLLAP